MATIAIAFGAVLAGELDAPKKTKVKWILFIVLVPVVGTVVFLAWRRWGAPEAPEPPRR